MSKVDWGDVELNDVEWELMTSHDLHCEIHLLRVKKSPRSKYVALFLPSPWRTWHQNESWLPIALEDVLLSRVKKYVPRKVCFLCVFESGTVGSSIEKVSFSAPAKKWSPGAYKCSTSFNPYTNLIYKLQANRPLVDEQFLWTSQDPQILQHQNCNLVSKGFNHQATSNFK